MEEVKVKIRDIIKDQDPHDIIEMFMNITIELFGRTSTEGEDGAD